MLRRTVLLLVVSAQFISIATLHADEGETVYPRGYDAFQAGRDAQVYWDTRREDEINRQLGYNSLFRDRAAALSSTHYYQPYVPYASAYGYDWPYSFGQVYGYGFYDAVPQSIGRREVQTGPNRWESFPVYPEDVAEPTVTTRPYVEVPRVEPKVVTPPSREF